MPRRKSRWQQEEEAIMGSHDPRIPNDGDQYSDEDMPDEEEEATPPSPKGEEDPVKALQARMLDMEKRHSEELAALRRQIPPVQPKTPAPGRVEQKTDWGSLMFQDPDKAAQLLKEQAKNEIREEMTSTYQRDQGQRQFWQEFYEAHPDLKEDRDLVTTTLNGNLSDLANIPVEQAMERLAELTRNRILRYRNKPTQRARAEGANAPSPKPREPEPKVPTLGDVIKARRAGRRVSAA